LHLCSAKTIDISKSGSCSQRLKPVFVVQTAEHRFGDDTVAIANPMAEGRCGDAVVGPIWDAGPETRVWTPAIVVSHLCLANNPTAVRTSTQTTHPYEDSCLPTTVTRWRALARD